MYVWYYSRKINKFGKTENIKEHAFRIRRIKVTMIQFKIFNILIYLSKPINNKLRENHYQFSKKEAKELMYWFLHINTDRPFTLDYEVHEIVMIQ